MPDSLIAEQLVEIMHDVGSETTGVEHKLMGVYDGSVEVERGGRRPTVEDKREEGEGGISTRLDAAEDMYVTNQSGALSILNPKPSDLPRLCGRLSASLPIMGCPRPP